MMDPSIYFDNVQLKAFLHVMPHCKVIYAGYITFPAIVVLQLAAMQCVSIALAA